MDTINTFLDAMFAPYPATPRLLEAKNELRAMMEDAYNDAVASGRTHNEAVGAVITSFGNLEELAPVLGIATDLRAGPTPGAPPEAATPGSSLPPGGPGYGAPARHPAVTLPEAQRLAEARRKTADILGWAVMLFVLSPAAPTLLSALPGRAGGWNQDLLSMTSPALSLVIVAVGVFLLIHRSRAFAEVRHLTSGQFTADPVVSAWATRLRLEHEGPRIRRLAVAVCLWILAAVPVVTVSALEKRLVGSGISGLGPALALLVVAIGLRVYLPATWASSTEKTLRHESWSAQADAVDDDDPVIGVVAAIYWPACLVAFFLWSYFWDAWGISWIIWPVSGALFGVVAGLLAATRSRSRRLSAAQGDAGRHSDPRPLD